MHQNDFLTEYIVEKLTLVFSVTFLRLVVLLSEERMIWKIENLNG
jgi:hypothetical protein